MGGFYGSKDDDAEVENLLNQLQEESILKLNLNSHRSTGSFRSSLPSSSVEQQDTGDGLDGNLLARFANLKKGNVETNVKPQTEQKSRKIIQETQETGGSDNNNNNNSKPDDKFLDSEVEERLAVLKTKSKTSSFSPLKLIKQLSGGRRKSSKSKSWEESGSFSGEWIPEYEDADKLLASVAQDVKLAKKQLKKDEELKDLNVRRLNREFSKASGEEDKLAREAEKVVEWAKDAARLDPDSEDDDDDGEECEEDVHELDDLDLEELLKMEQDQDEHNKKDKKKKGKKWGLF